jgi:hypothetical protein
MNTKRRQRSPRPRPGGGTLKQSPRASPGEEHRGSAGAAKNGKHGAAQPPAKAGGHSKE